MSEIPAGDKFYHREVRGGFVISEVMKHCWAADLHILEDLKGICRASGLQFFAAYGTLLGSIRHAGYIPWDDDVDIGMVRDDYIALTDILAESDKYNVLNPYTRSWYNMNFSHVTNNGDLCFTREYLKEWKGCPFLTGPDIYPYYYIPRDPGEEEYILGVLERIDNAIAISKEAEAKAGDKRVAGLLNEKLAMALVGLERETGYSFNTERPIQNQLEILYDQVCRLTEAEDADYLVRYDEYTKDRNKKFPKEYLENVIEVPFENTTIPVPAGYGAVLRARFGGGYLKPVQERGAHDYPYYKKQLGSVGNKLEEAVLGSRKDGMADAGAHIPQSDGKKIMVYYTAIRELLIHSDRTADRIREVLDVYADVKDKWLICWVPGEIPETDELAFDEIVPDMIREYKELKEQAADLGIMVIDETENTADIVKNADIFFGDESLISEAFEKAHKPVFIQDYDTNGKEELGRILADREV